MKASEYAIKLIEKYEGCRLTAYKCPAGVWTIGYGHTGQDVKAGQVITQAEAERLLVSDVESVERQLALVGDLPLTQCQYDAVVSFCFNVGVGAFRKSTMCRLIKARAHEMDIAKEFLKWVNAGGKKLEGLVKRRNEEALVFLGCACYQHQDRRV